jgi:hypothetical protein
MILTKDHHNAKELTRMIARSSTTSRYTIVTAALVANELTLAIVVRIAIALAQTTLIVRLTKVRVNKIEFWFF